MSALYSPAGNPGRYGLSPLAHGFTDSGRIEVEALIAEQVLGLAGTSFTGEQAEVFGLKDRGRIAEGAAADLVVFDPGTIDCGPISMRGDLPCGESRLYGDAVGIHHVIVNGVPVAAGNQPTGRRGGRMLRSGRDSYTVPLS